MIKSLSSFICRITNRTSLIIFAAAIAGFEIAFSILMPEFNEITAGPLLDMSVWFTPEFAYERLSSFGKAADIYFKIRTIDFFFPAVYAVGLACLSCAVYRKKYKNEENYRWVLFAPLAGALFDYFENIMLVILYRSLPAEYPAAATVLNYFTLIKFGLLGLSILLIVTGFLSLLKGGDSMLLMGNKFRGDKKE